MKSNKEIAEIINEPACEHNHKAKSGCAKPTPCSAQTVPPRRPAPRATALRRLRRQMRQRSTQTIVADDLVHAGNLRGDFIAAPSRA